MIQFRLNFCSRFVMGLLFLIFTKRRMECSSCIPPPRNNVTVVGHYPWPLKKRHICTPDVMCTKWKVFTENFLELLRFSKGLFLTWWLVLYMECNYNLFVFSKGHQLTCTMCPKTHNYDGGCDFILNMGTYMVHHEVLRDYVYHFLNSRQVNQIWYVIMCRNTDYYQTFGAQHVCSLSVAAQQCTTS